MLVKRFIAHFSKQVPVVDVTSFVQKSGSASSQCSEVAEALHKYGAVCIKDPRVNDKHNVDFLHMMEDYFETRSKKLYNHEKVLIMLNS